VADEETDNLDTTDDSASDEDGTEETEQDEAGTDNEASTEDGTDESATDEATDADAAGTDDGTSDSETDDGELPEKYRGKTVGELVEMHQNAERLVGSPDQVEYRQFRENQEDFNAYRRERQEHQEEQETVPVWNPPHQFDQQMAANLGVLEANAGSEDPWAAVPEEHRAKTREYVGYVNEQEQRRVHDPVGYYQEKLGPMIEQMFNDGMGRVIAQSNAVSFTEDNPELVRNPEFSKLLDRGMDPALAKELMELRAKGGVTDAGEDAAAIAAKKAKELKARSARGTDRRDAPHSSTAEELSKMSVLQIAKEAEEELAAGT